MPQACTRGSKSIRVSGEVLIYASRRASPLGELHKCFSHTFQFFRKFLLQRHCKMHVCACVELLSVLWSKVVFLFCLWVGIILPWLLMGCIPGIQPQRLAPPHFWVHALSPPPSVHVHAPYYICTCQAITFTQYPHSLQPLATSHILRFLLPNAPSSPCVLHHLHATSLPWKRLRQQSMVWSTSLVLQLPTGTDNQRSAAQLPLH